MKKTLYLECYSGISGDMTVGALLDLGADKDVLLRALDSLQVEGYKIKIGRTKKCGIDACDFDVILEHQEEGGHHHPHEHRNIHDVFAVIDRLEAPEAVKELSRKMFRIVAQAEAKAHGIPQEEVHFHEVGAIDSIVDIISVAVCLDNLGIEDVIVSPLWEGSGHVHCQHGIIPVPVPAVVNIASMNRLTLKLTDNAGEMVTPTGAAIAAALRTSERLPKDYRVLKIGIGAGKKDFPKANILRAMLIEPCEQEQRDVIWTLETNIDDCTGEALGFAMERLMEAGARDVFYTPIFMKKNRPAYLLKVICTEDKIEELEDLIFAHTTTVGIRRTRMERTILNRRMDTVDTPHGTVEVKVCTGKGSIRAYPEYESIRKICLEQKKDFQTVYRSAVCAAEKKWGGEG